MAGGDLNGMIDALLTRDTEPLDRGISLAVSCDDVWRVNGTATTERANNMDAQQLATIVGTYQREAVTVQYQDVANPLRVGTVVEHVAGEFRIAWDDDEGGETWSDLRQAGWAPATPGATRERRTSSLISAAHRREARSLAREDRRRTLRRNDDRLLAAILKVFS